MKTGAKGGSLKILSDNELERIYQASLSIPEMIRGYCAESDLFLDIFQKGGGESDREQRTIRVLHSDMVRGGA